MVPPACVGELVPDVNIFSLGLDYILLFLCLSVFLPKLLGLHSCVAHCWWVLRMTDLALLPGQFSGMCIGKLLRGLYPASFINFEGFFGKGRHHLVSFVPILYCIRWPLLGINYEMFWKADGPSYPRSRRNWLVTKTIDGGQGCSRTQWRAWGVGQVLAVWLWASDFTLPQLSSWTLRVPLPASGLLWEFSEIANARHLAQCQSHRKYPILASVFFDCTYTFSKLRKLRSSSALLATFWWMWNTGSSQATLLSRFPLLPHS